MKFKENSLTSNSIYLVPYIAKLLVFENNML